MWLSVWSKVQTCIWPSLCHCHSLSLPSVQPYWFYLSATGSPGYSQKHTYTRLTALFPGLPRWAGTRKVKPIWIFPEKGPLNWCVCVSPTIPLFPCLNWFLCLCPSSRWDRRHIMFSGCLSVCVYMLVSAVVFPSALPWISSLYFYCT